MTSGPFFTATMNGTSIFVADASGFALHQQVRLENGNLYEVKAIISGFTYWPGAPHGATAKLWLEPVPDVILIEPSSRSPFANRHERRAALTGQKRKGWQVAPRKRTLRHRPEEHQETVVLQRRVLDEVGR